MYVNADAVLRKPIDNNKEESKHLQVDDNDTFMISYEKITYRRIFKRNKQENSNNEVKPLKRRNLNPVMVPDDVDHFSEI